MKLILSLVSIFILSSQLTARDQKSTVGAIEFDSRPDHLTILSSGRLEITAETDSAAKVLAEFYNQDVLVRKNEGCTRGGKNYDHGDYYTIDNGGISDILVQCQDGKWMHIATRWD